jgi:hypothetical protein
MSKVHLRIEVYQQQTCIFIQIFESEQEMDSLRSDGIDADCDYHHQTM